MKKQLLFLGLVSFLCLASAPIHDVPLSNFKLVQKDAAITLQVSLDLDDFYQSTGQQLNEDSAADVEEYLQTNSTWSFDGQVQILQLDSLQLVRRHLWAFGHFEDPPAKWEKLTITNECLLNVPNQSNIIQVEVGEQVKGYRMHQGRTSIEVIF